MNKKGFTLPIVLLFVLAFIAIPLVFWISALHNKNQPGVQGAEDVNNKTGLYVKITSTFGSWDLFEYLCTTKDECLAALDGGKKWEGISGGATTGSSFKIDYSELWKDFKYLKLFIKPGWGSSAHPFNLQNASEISGSLTKVIDNTVVIIVPTSLVEASQYTFLMFTDKF